MLVLKTTSRWSSLIEAGRYRSALEATHQPRLRRQRALFASARASAEVQAALGFGFIQEAFARDRRVCAQGWCGSVGVDSELARYLSSNRSAGGRRHQNRPADEPAQSIPQGRTAEVKREREKGRGGGEEIFHFPFSIFYLSFFISTAEPRLTPNTSPPNNK
jgi:hypothetical protein